MMYVDEKRHGSIKFDRILTLNKGECTDSDYVKLITLQLDYARISNLLVFSRDKQTQHLARKLKGEFGRVFFSSDVKESQKMLSLHNNSKPDALRIDIILSEYDTAAAKLIDNVIRRPYLPETSNCPIIPVVLLINSGNERDAKDHFLNNAGSIKFVRQSAPIKDVLLTMIDVLYGCRKVEDIFKDVKKGQLVSSKFTYLPIFESNSIADGKREGKDDESISEKSDNSSLSQIRYQVDEIEDASECSRLLPEVVVNSPLMKAKRENETKSRAQLEAENEEAQRKKEESEREELRKWRENQMKKLEAKLEGVKEEEEEPELKKEPSFKIEQKVTINLLESQVARIDSVYLGNSVESDDDDEEEKRDQFGASNRRKPKSELLLDPKCRPRWVVTEDISKQKDEEGMKYDISTFINKSPPKLKRPLTVGGLDRKSAENCWKLIKNPQDETVNKDRQLSFFRRPLSVSGSFDLGNNRSSSFLAGAGGKTPVTPGAGGTRRSFIQSTASIDEHVQMTIERLKLNSDQFEAQMQQVDGGNRSPHRRQRRNNSIASSVLSTTSWELYDNTKEEKKITFLAKKNPPDYQVSNILDIDFTHRKINLGEKDMLQRGLKLENQGDFKAAINCYTNAGAHSKDQQISRMLLGNLNYRNGRLMTALKFYTTAIQIIEMKPEALRLPHDQFLAYYNRSIINFRLGADEEGIEDLEKATKAHPNDIAAHELLSLAKRRVGKYNEAIDEAIISDTHRQEKKKKELLKAIEDAKKLQRLELGLNQNNNTLPDGRRMSNKLPGRKSSVQVQAAAAFAALMNPNTRISMRKLSKSETSQSSGRSSLNRPKTANEAAAVVSSTTAAIAHRREEYFKDLSPTKGLVLEIDQSYCYTSLRDKVNESKRSYKGVHGSSNDIEDINGGEGSFLKSFKIKNNCKGELFEEIFLKPNQLQEALLVEPFKRVDKSLNIVMDALKQFPYTSRLSLSALSELASVIEYRTLQNKDDDKLFQQNDESGALMFLLSGEIETKMDSSTPTVNKDYENSRRQSMLVPGTDAERKLQGVMDSISSANQTAVALAAANASTSSSLFDISIGNVAPYSVFGHIDLLFRHPRPSFKKAVEEAFLQSIEHSKLWDRSPMNMMQQSSLLASNSLAGAAAGGTLPGISSSNVVSTHMPSIFNNGNEESIVSTTNDDGSSLAETERRFDDELFYKQITEFMNHWHKATGTSAANPNNYDNFHPSSKTDYKSIHRALHPGMFMNYAMQSPCEIMMISEKDFQRILYDYVVEEFLRRLKGILASGIFSGWKPEDIIRLARMGQIINVKNGETIVKQGRKPSYLYIILKGMCKVMKKPNRTEMLLQNLSIANEKAEQHDLKYVFHHRVARGGLESPGSSTGGGSSMENSPINSRHSSPVNSPKALRSSLSPNSKILSSPSTNLRKSVRRQKKINMAFANADAMKDFSTSVIMPPTKLTEAEKARHETAQEIDKLNGLIHKARILDAMEQKNAYQRRLTRMQRGSAMSNATTHLGLKRDDRTEDAKIQDLAYTLGNKYAEIRTIQWPMIFGEACILDPENGVSRGSIVADTACEIFAIHKVQLQTFQIDDNFLERVKAKVVAYPADSDMVVNLYQQQEWKEYRKEVLKKVASATTLKQLSIKNEMAKENKKDKGKEKHSTKKK